MKFFIRNIFFCAALMFSQNISAQFTSASSSSGGQYFFTNYTVDNGLSNNTVGCIVKDSEGYIWIGTEAGLNRFNGYDFTVYKSVAEDSTTISSNGIRNLLSDHDGNLWIGTAQGLCLYDRKKNSFRRMDICGNTETRLPMNECYDLFEDSRKNIWAGTGFGLLRYNPKEGCFQRAFVTLQLKSKNMVTSISEDSDGSLWMVNYHYVVHLNPSDSSFTEYENKFSASDKDRFQALKVFPDASDKNYLWIATWGNGLVHFHKKNGEFTSYKFQPGGSPNLDNIVFNIFRYSNSELWLCTNRGALRYDEVNRKFGSFVRDSINEKPLLNMQVQRIYRDDEGVIWIGTNGGICNIHPDKQNFLSQPLWPKPPVNSYYYDEAAEKFYAVRIYSNRVLVINDRRKNIVEEFSIPDADRLTAEPFSVVKDNSGLIWIGTTKGIYTFDESQKKFSLFEIESQLHIPDRSIYVRQILKDSDGNLWVSCYSRGLLMIEAGTKKIISYQHDEHDSTGFPLFAVTGIAEGNNKTLYACDDRCGVAVFSRSNKKIAHFNAKEKKYSMLNDAVDIAVDKSNRIWVTTRNNGLICIDENREATAYIKDDFGNIMDEQGSVVIDDSGKVWFAASNGIYSFDPSLKSFAHFTVQDGLPVRTIGEPLHRLRDGKIAYNYFRGIFYFDPSKVLGTTKPLQVHLTSLLVNGKNSSLSNFIDHVDTLALNHLENNLAFEFAANNFRNSEATLYSYMLEGNDKNWSAPSRTRTVNFSQLSPGNYWLRIRAGENSPEKKIFIQIIPAWWQTKWFRWFVIISVLAILFFGIRYYLSFRYRQRIAVLERQHEIENIRMRISRDIHDEIGSGLTKIKLMSRNLSKTKEESVMKETTAKISTASDELIQNLGEIVWTVNPANDTLENVFAFVRNYVSKLFDENPEIRLKLDFTSPEKIPHVSINPEVKRNLLLIIKEALTNIFKHAHPTEVSVEFRADNSKLELQVRDNGKGIQKEGENDFGNGLKNMRKRAESIHAEFTFESSPEKGTSISLNIPIRSA
jgi:ligand-binding sensor domain-containing protein/signal transduction histidine kinase